MHLREYVFVVAALSASQSNASPVEVSNFVSGLACTETAVTQGRDGWICQPTELVLVTDQGECVYDRKQELCTWIGFEFDYRAEAKGAKIKCTSQNSEAISEGNYEGVRDPGSTRREYELELPEKEGHFYNPQYFLFAARDSEDRDLLVETTCASEGKTVFSFRFQIRFPARPRSRATNQR